MGLLCLFSIPVLKSSLLEKKKTANRVRRDSLAVRYVLKRTCDEYGASVVDWIHLAVVAAQCWVYVNAV